MGKTGRQLGLPGRHSDALPSLPQRSTGRTSIGTSFAGCASRVARFQVRLASEPT